MVNMIPDGTDDNASADFLNTVLDDEAGASIQSQSGPVTNASFRPAYPLSGFDGKAGNGTWTLRVMDLSIGDFGSVNAWSLTIAPLMSSCAAFTPQQFTLTLTPAGSGTVTSSPSGITCGGACQATYDRGTTVSLAATAAAGSAFAGWSGGGCSGTGARPGTGSAGATVTPTLAAVSLPFTGSSRGSAPGAAAGRAPRDTLGTSRSAGRL